MVWKVILHYDNLKIYLIYFCRKTKVMDFSFLILSQDSMLIFGHRMLSSSTTLLRTVFYIQSYLLTVLFFFFVPQGEDGDAAVPSVTTRADVLFTASLLYLKTPEGDAVG